MRALLIALPLMLAAAPAAAAPQYAPPGPGPEVEYGRGRLSLQPGQGFLHERLRVRSGNEHGRGDVEFE